MNKKVYLYSIFGEKFNVYKGELIHMNGIGSFKTDFKRRFQCSSEPGIVFNSVVWIEEENESLGRELLIEYQKQQIVKLQEKINSHLNKISILEDK